MQQDICARVLLSMSQAEVEKVRGDMGIATSITGKQHGKQDLILRSQDHFLFLPCSAR
jgi:hypothetical protein